MKISSILLRIAFLPFVVSQTWHSFNGSEYMFRLNAKSHEEAVSDCNQQNAHLANMKTKEISQFLDGIISSFLETLDDLDFYIGATRVPGTDKFRWTDGTIVTYAKWDPDQPNNIYGNQDYVTWYSDLIEGWWDVACSRTFRYICERTIPVTTHSQATYATSSNSIQTTLTMSTQTTPHTNNKPAAVNPSIIGGTVIGVIVIIAIIVCIVVFCMMSQKCKRKRAEMSMQLTGVDNPTTVEDPVDKPTKTRHDSAVTYVNSNQGDGDYEDIEPPCHSVYDFQNNQVQTDGIGVEKGGKEIDDSDTYAFASNVSITLAADPTPVDQIYSQVTKPK